MTQSRPRYSRIVGTGGYLPEKVLTNHDLEKMVETSDEWIRERTGIRQRHIAADDQTTADLAEQAARKALDAADLAPESLELIIVATTTPDKIFPSTACLLQRRLGNRGAPAFDVQAVCSGFIYALSVADQFIRTGMASNALVVGAETLSRIIDWQDRNTCVLFGDGAGAVALRADDEAGVLSTHIHADGRYEDLLHVPSGVSKRPQTDSVSERSMHMRGSEVFKVAVNTLSRVALETLAHNRLSPEALDYLVPHQANKRIIDATGRKMKLRPDQVVVTVDRHANTSAASVPLALDEAVRDGRIRRGHLIMMEAFGGGFTWGSALVRF